MLDNILQKINLTEENAQIKTDFLTIENGAIATSFESFNINNIVTVSKDQLKSPIDQKVILTFIILIFLSFALIGIPFLILYTIHIKNEYNKYLQSKHCIVFTLTTKSSHILYFNNTNFRDKVFQVITKSFNNKNSSFTINMKTENIEHQNLFTDNSTQNNTNISGNNNITGNNKNINFTQGNNNSQSNTNTLSELNWSELKSDLEKTLNNPHITSELKNILTELLEATKSQNKELLTTIAKRNENELNNSFVRDILSGTIAGVLSAIFIK